MRNAVSFFLLLTMTSVLIPPAAAERGGSISVGENKWTLVPSVQCSIYPGNIVSIAGHAAQDQSLEIVIDYGGPTGVRVGAGSDAWHAQQDSIDVQIDGKRIEGTATFFQYSGKPEDTQQGRFDVSCI